MLSTRFISATKDYTTYEHHVPAPYLRKSFCVTGELHKAQITICGLGFYRLFINGTEITKGHMAPYISNPDDILYYDSYDIAAYLKDGKNAIGILLGNGFLNCPGGSVWDFEQARFRSAPKVALALELQDDSGDCLIEADETFRVHPSAILFDDMRCGEFYDARREVDGWNLPDFDDSDWAFAISAECPRGEHKLCTAEPIVVLEERQPISIVKKEEPCFVFHPHGGHVKIRNIPVFLTEEEQRGYLFDFGENLAGLLRLKVRGEAGQRISVQTAEILNAEGKLDIGGWSFQPQGLNHRFVYTLKGGCEEIYVPSFTYFGFRYCLVSGITEQQATKDLLTYLIMSSDLKKNGDFHCSDEVLNKLQRATVNANRANFYYFPTDCPHREKNGWTADAALSAEQMLFNMTPANSYRVWLDNIRKAQREDGALPGIIPTAGWGFQWGNGPAWDSVLFYLPFYSWQYRGDTEIIRENALAMIRYLNYLSTRRDADGLLHIGLGDWCHCGGKLPMTPLVVTDTLMSMDLCDKAEKMFSAIGMNLQASFARNFRQELRAAARDHLIAGDSVTVMGNTQTGQVLGIAFGLFEEGEKRGALEVLLRLIHDANDRISVGVLGGRQIFHVLADHGYWDLAYRMIVGPEFPSYGYWIKSRNATALLEDFNNHQSGLETSHNHHFWGDISAWFFKRITGVKVNPYLRDVNQLEISPCFITDLSFAESYHDLPAGRISVRWERLDDAISLNIELPKGCYGTLRLPYGFMIDTGKTYNTCSADLIPGNHNYRILKI